MSMHPTLTPILAAGLALWWSMPAQAETGGPAPGKSPANSGSTAELDEARALLEQFKTAVEKDPAEARRIFQIFLTKSERVQKGFGRHLDTEWKRRKNEYLRQQWWESGHLNGGAPRPNPVVLENIRAKRELLAQIRAMTDEGAMKKRLAASGWPALQFLEKLYGRGTFNLPAELTAPASGEENAAAQKRKQQLDTTLLIGKLRRTLFHDVFLEYTTEPEVELGLKPGAGGPALVHMTAGQHRVLEQNQYLAKNIQPAEAAGIRQLNEWRISAGLNPLIIDPKLCAAARDHCKDMAAMKFFSHTSPVTGKETPWKRAKNFGTAARSENIAINGSVKGANKSWFHSPGHHKNMFGPHQYAGLGNHGKHWALMLR